MPRREQAKIAGGLMIAVSVWLIISPLVLGFTGTPAAANTMLVGIIVGVLALLMTSSPELATWLGTANIVLGAWIVIISFFLGLANNIIIGNNIISGLIIIILAEWISSASAKLRIT